MRLTPQQIETIRAATVDVFGPTARVRLVGSRLDDMARGGDIDLLVECPEALQDAGLKAARLSALIQMRIGEQKIDVC